jgi:hypothetical protein
MENTEENCEMIFKIWGKNSENIENMEENYVE